MSVVLSQGRLVQQQIVRRTEIIKELGKKRNNDTEHQYVRTQHTTFEFLCKKKTQKNVKKKTQKLYKNFPTHFNEILLHKNEKKNEKKNSIIGNGKKFISLGFERV